MPSRESLCLCAETWHWPVQRINSSRAAPLIAEVRSEAMAEADQSAGTSSEKAKRREARAIVGAYHQEQLRALLEHVRDGSSSSTPASSMNSSSMTSSTATSALLESSGASVDPAAASGCRPRPRSRPCTTATRNMTGGSKALDIETERDAGLDARRGRSASSPRAFGSTLRRALAPCPQAQARQWPRRGRLRGWVVRRPPGAQRPGAAEVASRATRTWASSAVISLCQ